MKYLIALFVIIFTAEGSNGLCRQSTPRVQLMMPESVFTGEDMRATCIADHENRPRVVAIKDDRCNAKIEYLDINGEDEKCGRTDFLVRNVSATCTYKCIFHRSCEERTVPVVDAKIISPSSNVTINENMPVRLNCTVKANAYSKHHTLLWIEGDTFVPSGDLRYSMWSSKFECDTNTQDYYLTIHRVVHPTTYACALLSTSGKVVDLKTHQLFLTEADSVVISLFQYLAKFFVWNNDT